jgi:3-deoxy-D-arabino-heptulosonate 7-phosphate (DAHP) synthase
LIIAGNCSYLDISEQKHIIDNAYELKAIGVDYFRCKLWLGGTTPEKFMKGIESEGIQTLNWIDKNVIATGTEIHIPEQFALCDKMSYIWIGARNARNYSLLNIIGKVKPDKQEIMIKRAPDMIIAETIGLYDICVKKFNFCPYIIERGQVNIDRLEDSRWSPDIKGVIRIKQERPDIFDRLVIDCSHSVGRKEYIKDIYKAFKAVDCKHYMFESTLDGKSKTDERQMLSVKELKNIIE